MSDLEVALDEFRAAMLAKFVLRAAKRGNRSVTIDGNLDCFEPREAWPHYLAEIEERLTAEGWENKSGEDIDVANMAFLSWYSHRRVKHD